MRRVLWCNKALGTTRFPRLIPSLSSFTSRFSTLDITKTAFSPLKVHHCALTLEFIICFLTLVLITQTVSTASGEPPLLLAASVHCATRSAIREARKQSLSWNCSDGNGDVSGGDFELPVPATMPVVKGLCGLYSVEKYLEEKICGK